MAEPRKTSGKSTAGPPREGSRRWRMLLPLLFFAAAAGVVVLALVMLREGLFTGNPRLMLREVKVRSTGYWRNREKPLCGRIGLETGVNLFSLDLKALRRRLERIPCIASAEVRRVPPDTVEVKLEERIPRAVLGNPRSPFVIDEHAVVIPRTESMAEKEKLRLPVVTGIPLRNLQPGSAEPRLQGAVDLIMVTLRGFPDIRILQLSVDRPGSYDLRMTYRENILYHVILPVRKSGNAFLLSALQSAIIAARRRGDSRTTFDLSFEGQVVVR